MRHGEDAALLVEGGIITARGGFADVTVGAPGVDVVDLRDGLLLPGLVDTHVHYPQVRVIGALGMPLLDWLDQCALPEEARMADSSVAAVVAQEFLTGLISAGTTSALVFGSHFASAMDVLFAVAEGTGLRITSGLVVSDRLLPQALLTTPERAADEAETLIGRWHGTGRLRYAVTPRFSYSCTEDLLAACGQTFAEHEGVAFTSHVNENVVEVAEVTRMFGVDYVGTYEQHGLLDHRSVLAHNVHPIDSELVRLAQAGSSVAHCPTSNCALGSGLFPLRRHVEAGVRVALGSDVGAGTGFSLFKEGLQAYFLQQLRVPDGLPLTSTHLLYLATSAGAQALGLADQVGDLSVGKAFDAVLVRPEPGDPLSVGLAHATSAEDALAKVFALATTADVARVWVGGDPVKAPGSL